jgi:hypothetical protein
MWRGFLVSSVNRLDGVHKPWTIIAQFCNLFMTQPFNLVVFISPRPPRVHLGEIQPHDCVNSTRKGHHSHGDSVTFNIPWAFLGWIEL